MSSKAFAYLVHMVCVLCLCRLFSLFLVSETVNWPYVAMMQAPGVRVWARRGVVVGPW